VSSDKNAQSKLASVIQRTTKARVEHIQIPVSVRKHTKMPFPSDSGREESQRTRSFLFTYKATEWKKYRISKHTHNPVDDARGNAEALRKFKELGLKI
jgi:hypothetical protein